MNEMMSEQIYETMENFPDALINFGDGPVEIRVREAERRLDLKVSSRPVGLTFKDYYDIKHIHPCHES